MKLQREIDDIPKIYAKCDFSDFVGVTSTPFGIFVAAWDQNGARQVKNYPTTDTGQPLKHNSQLEKLFIFKHSEMLCHEYWYE